MYSLIGKKFRERGKSFGITPPPFNGMINIISKKGSYYITV